MSKRFIITLHDTSYSKGVAKTIERLRLKKDIEVINFPELWCGLSIVKPKKAPSLDPFQKEFNTLLPGFNFK